MWLVLLALRRPYTVIVAALLIVLLAGVTIRRMGTDIFPEIEIPVVAVVFSYNGISPDEMEKRVVSGFERLLTTTVNDIQHIESQSLAGMGMVKVFFHPGARIEAATAQVTAISQTAIRSMPPGMTPPIVLRYSASNVPVLQASLGSETLSEQQVFDLGNNVIRTSLATVQGAQVPNPYGGKQRLVMIDIDPERLHALGLSATDISDALGNQSLVLPAGTAKLGGREYGVRLNSSPDRVAEFLDLPLRKVGDAVVCLRDVATVRDGYSPQTSMVHVDGRKGVIQQVFKAGGASTIDLVARVRAGFARIMTTVPPELTVTLLADQSVFVRAAIDSVVHEGVMAAGLTGLMILLFLGSWRSTLIVVLSIPLSVLTAIILLSWCGQTLNLMTLGGLALAVGILVDDATVAIENIHRNLEEPAAGGARKGLTASIIDGAQQIAVPTLVSTLSICIVFVPVVFITGAARSLFVPMAMAVVFAMLTSYLLSRTLVPTLVQWLMRGAHRHGAAPAAAAPRRGLAARAAGAFHRGFERGFLVLQGLHRRGLDWCLGHRLAVAGIALLVLAGAALSVPLIGRDFFPAVDAGQLRMHVRCPPGTRIEETERWFARVEAAIREEIPAGELGQIVDVIGMPSSPINLILGDASLVSAATGEIQVSLRHGHAPTAEHVRRLRRRMAQSFPELTTFFLAADISSQVLNFGLPAPLDIQVSGPVANQAANVAVAQRIADALRQVPGAVDVHLHQVAGAPELRVDVDRTRAVQAGLTQRDAASSLLIALSSSQQTAPGYWLDAARGVQYSVAIQAPQARIDSLQALGNVPVARGGVVQPLGNLATVRRTGGPVNISHYNVAPTIDVLAGVDGTDLGSVAGAAQRIADGITADLPRGSFITIRGQAESMDSSFLGLAFGLVFAVVLVYLLLVVNFQSWSDPLIILGAVPGALAGILWMLFLTHTTFSVPALMGAIMSIGVATANSILVVSFANDQRRLGHDPRHAALLAGNGRLRPVLMTAAAMVIGMLPMALALGEGSEQNAPLARAVIGGLVLATASTLFVVPVLYSAVSRRRAAGGPAQAGGDDLILSGAPA